MQRIAADVEKCLMLQDSLKLITLGNVLILINSVNHLINLYFRLHFILKYCIVGYIIAYIYSFQVHPVAFDYSRVRWLWIHTSTLWLDLQSYYNFSLASQEQAFCQGTEKYERHRQNSPCDISGSTVIYEATRILFVHKENQNNDFIQQLISSALA